MTTRVFLTLATLLLASPPASAEAILTPQTSAAFDKYVRLTEARIAADVASADRFVILDAMPDRRRRETAGRLRAGDLAIERRETRDGGVEIDVPDGLIHHWVGLAFVPGATVEEVVRLLQDYDRHHRVYGPAVADSKLLARDGGTFRVFLRFYQKKGVSVVVNSEHEARYTRVAGDRVHSRVVSTRIAEVEAPREREKPVGRDNGFLWRLNTYWRLLERDGGTYIECESISLSRDIPFGLGWIVGPFVTSIPRESLEFTMGRTRDVLTAAR